MRAEAITDSVAQHGEGPVWSERWGGLRWVDMLKGDILSLRRDGTVNRRKVGGVVAAMRPRAFGGAVLAVERGFAVEEPNGSLHVLGDIWSDAGIRMNDGGCDPDGRFYCGSMAYDQRPGAAALYRFDPDRSVHVVLEGVTISNGLEWSPDGTRAYYADTATHRVDVFDYDLLSGLTNRRPLVELGTGFPDGLTVDSQGGVWVALYGGGAVHRYSAEGGLTEIVDVPTPKVTACTLGGQRLDELYITTSREDIDLGNDPLAGALFRARVGVAGLPARGFAG
jgi:sugar lactone lactonase YvrE